MNVGELKKELENYPDDMEVMIVSAFNDEGMAEYIFLDGSNICSYDGEDETGHPMYLPSGIVDQRIKDNPEYFTTHEPIYPPESSQDVVCLWPVTSDD